MPTLITSADIIPEVKIALRTDRVLNGDTILGLTQADCPTIVQGHSGTFEYEVLPLPAIVLAPLDEDNPRYPVTRNGEKIIQIMVHAYAENFASEEGLTDVMTVINRAELLLDDNRLTDNLVARSWTKTKSYPLPPDMNYVGLNEARLLVEFLTINAAFY
jgi:uncharacterized ubiquitin-like protein YukD